MDTRRRLQTLKIQIDTVKSITVRLCHHIFNQFFAHRRPGKKHLRLHVLAAFAAEIVEYRPDLQTFFMRPIHIDLSARDSYAPLLLLSVNHVAR